MRNIKMKCADFWRNQTKNSEMSVQKPPTAMSKDGTKWNKVPFVSNNLWLKSIMRARKLWERERVRRRGREREGEQRRTGKSKRECALTGERAVENSEKSKKKIRKGPERHIHAHLALADFPMPSVWRWDTVVRLLLCCHLEGCQ